MLRLPRLSSRQLPLKLLKSPILTRTLFSLDSDAQFFFCVYYFWISSFQDINADDPSNVMLLSCQDPLLVGTYKNLPRLP